MGDTSISWTDKVWNPVTGCTKVSPGCKHCYAETIADRFFAKQYQPNADGSPRRFTDVRTHEDRLDAPLHWKKPQKVFVNSMSDLFHEDVANEFIDRVFAVMALSPQHTFQVLTKRPERMRDYFAGYRPSAMLGEAFNMRFRDMPDGGVLIAPLPNVWLGTSAEDQQRFDERSVFMAPLMRAGWLTWVSAEPLLGTIIMQGTSAGLSRNWLGEPGYRWIVCGGESGVGARPCRLSWFRSIISQCQAASVPVFFKQAGSNFHSDSEVWPDAPKYTLSSYRFGLLQSTTELNRCKNGRWKLSDNKGGFLGELPEDLRVRQFPVTEVQANAKH